MYYLPSWESGYESITRNCTEHFAKYLTNVYNLICSLVECPGVCIFTLVPPKQCKRVSYLDKYNVSPYNHVY